MRIALCVSGQPRTWEKCYTSWFNLVSHLGDVDVFCHLLDFNTLPSVSSSVTLATDCNTPVSQNELDKMIHTLKPKLYKIDTARLLPSPVSKYPVAAWARSQFCGLKYCAMLRRQYEIDNNFQYDVVVRVRPDALLHGTIDATDIQHNTIYSCSNAFLGPDSGFRLSDICFYANSYAYDQLANFYNATGYINAKTAFCVDSSNDPPEMFLYYYLKSIGLHNKISSIYPKLVRTAEYVSIMGQLHEHEML
jgi:hypothetical protein